MTFKTGDRVRLTGAAWRSCGIQDSEVTVSGNDEDGDAYFFGSDERELLYILPGHGYEAELVETASETKDLSFETRVKAITASIADLLIGKNRKYGNSALEPERVFSSAETAEAIRVRIDDKLSRIKTSDPEDQEDSISDLIGYCILLKIAEGK